MASVRLRQRFPQDEEILVVDSYEKKKKPIKRVNIWEMSAAGLVLSAISFVVSMALFLLVFVPLAVGKITPWELILGARFQVEANTVSRLGMSPHHLKTSQRGNFHEWKSDRNLQTGELFHRDEYDLEGLLPCLAGTYKQDIFPRNSFKKIYSEITFKISMETEDILTSSPIVVGGPLITEHASMAPMLNQHCNSQLLVQVAGEAMVFYRAARQEKNMHGMSISPWLGVHLQAGDALTWFPGTLFYIEPLTSLSLSMVIEEIADDITHREAAIHTVDFDVLEDKMYIEQYVHVMTDCHGIWPATISSRS
ncbi:hypothetical protein CAPTEDRAFT_199403 [Capitella teleta]|uniref:Uncharacterized protein n=1 Tax=Capitella teleta TaxID=283909 RepID=R7UX35_CAPTE|nr:hypothetical protein CAPTEDRAFT_199403 [Capitella teleta]|eukprot:ELU10904.1 hypothetical protein CAPTEDRAFT_199403 [Capitella teleta]